MGETVVFLKLFSITYENGDEHIGASGIYAFHCELLFVEFRNMNRSYQNDFMTTHKTICPVRSSFLLFNEAICFEKPHKGLL